MKHALRFLLLGILLFSYFPSYCWGFYGHQKINYFAVFFIATGDDGAV
jgi:hypothetical protein